MRKHNGIRPQDIVILLKIAAKGDQSWMMKHLAAELDISPSEVSESLHRSEFSGLISSDKRRIQKSAFLEFLIHGLKYTFPVHLGGMSRGLPTAYSVPPLSDWVRSENAVVWPYADGTVRGASVEPLTPNLPKACVSDPMLHLLASLVDALRIGKAREIEFASKELRDRI